MTRSILITLFLYISTTSGQSPRDLLVSRCPCMNRQQCIIRLGDDDFDDDEIFRSVPVCPLGTVPCCSRFQMRAIVREAFSGAPPPLIQTGRDLIPGPAVGPTSGELDELARLLETQAPAGLQQVPAGLQGRQQPDFAALLAGLDAPGSGAPGNLVVGDLSEADALAGLDSLAAGLTGGVAGQGVLPAGLPGISDVDALAGLDSLATSLQVPGVGGVSDADALAGLDSLAGLGAGLPTPPADLFAAVPAPVQASVPLPVAPVHVPGPLPQQAPGPQAPSVQIIGPQPVYISSDRVVGPSVNGAGRALHPGAVEKGRQADQLSGDQLAFLRALRALFK